MEFIDYWYLFIRQKKVVAATVAATLLVALLYVVFAPRIYEADCKLLIVDSNEGGLLGQLGGSDLMLGSLGKSDPIATQIEVVKTRPILREVIKRCDLTDSKKRPLREDLFAKKIKPSALRSTNIIQITYRNRDRGLAANVLNTLAQVVAEQNQRLNQEQMRATRLFIEMQLDAQKTKLEEAEQATVNFKKQEKTVSLDLQTKSRIDAAAELEAGRMRLESEQQGAIAQQKEIELSVTAPGAQADPFYAYRLNMLEQIKNRLSNIEAQRQAVNAQISHVNNNLSDLPQEEVRLARLLRDEKIASEIYTNLLVQFEEFKIKEAAKVASIKIIEPAVVPEKPVLPQKRQTLVAALALGLAFGCAIAFFMEYFDDAPGSLEEIKRVLPYGVLGAIPVVETKQQLYLQHAPSSLAAESIRLVHTNLKFKGVQDKRHLSLLVTSAQPGEGKSTTAANLALAFAAAGKKVALVNLDLRRPTFHRIFDTQFGKGVTDYLIGDATIPEIIYRPEGLKIDVVEAGSIPPNPTELIASESTQKLIAYLESSYAVCVFDSAPVTLVAETLDVARQMKGVVLVIDSSETSLKSLKAMQELFEGKNLPIMGIILNKFGAGKIGTHGYYGYGKYGNYGAHANYSYKPAEKEDGTPRSSMQPK